MKYKKYLLSSIFIANALLSGCNRSSNDNEKKHTKIEGLNDLKFGISFDEFSKKIDITIFNSSSLQDCNKFLPVRGCDLVYDNESPAYKTINGIPFNLGANFNQYNKLTDINLTYEIGHIKGEECIQLQERAIDWLTKEYGGFDYQKIESMKDHRIDIRKSKTGVNYAVETLINTPDAGTFVTLSMRTLPKNIYPRYDEKPIEDWDNNRYVSLTTMFFNFEEPVPGTSCYVDIEIKEPKSVERPKKIDNPFDEENM